jgi:hypothetical protein
LINPGVIEKFSSNSSTGFPVRKLMTAMPLTGILQNFKFFPVPVSVWSFLGFFRNFLYVAVF